MVNVRYNGQVMPYEQALALIRQKQASQPNSQPSSPPSPPPGGGNTYGNPALPEATWSNESVSQSQIPRKEGYHVSEIKPVQSGTEITYSPDAPAPVASSPQQPQFTDPISKRTFANVAGAQEAQRNPVGYATEKVLEIGGLATTLFVPVGAVKGALLSLGVGQVIKTGTQVYSGEQLTWLTPQEIKLSAAGGAIFSVGSGYVFAGAGKVFPVLAQKSLVGSVSRVGFTTGIGFGAGAGIGAGQATLANQDVGEGAKQGAIMGGAIAFSLSVAGETVGYLGRSVVKPRVERNLAKSYEPTLETGELWQPSLKEKVLMKLTGAEPRSPELVAKSSGMITESMKSQYDLNEAIMTGKPMPEDVGGRTGLSPWTPTAKEAEMIRFGASTHLADEITTVRVPGGDTLGLSGLERSTMAQDYFDYALAPRSSMRMDVIKPQVAASEVVSPTTRTLFWRGGGGVIVDKEFTTEIQRANTTEETRTFSIEGKLPENQMAYDYRGSLHGFDNTKPLTNVKGKLSFNEWPSVEEVAPKDTVLPSGPMKPLWESVGAKPVLNEPLMSTPKPSSQFTVQEGVKSISGTRLQQYDPTRYSGNSYYVTGGKLLVEETETMFLSYPNSPLPSPAQPKMVERVTQREYPLTFPSTPAVVNLKKKSTPSINQNIRGFSDIALNPMFDVEQTPSQTPMSIMGQPLIQRTPAPQKQRLRIPEATQTIDIPNSQSKPFLDLGFPLGGGDMSVGGPPIEGMGKTDYLGRRIRHYPVVDPLETLEFLF